MFNLSWTAFSTWAAVKSYMTTVISCLIPCENFLNSGQPAAGLAHRVMDIVSVTTSDGAPGAGL